MRKTNPSNRNFWLTAALAIFLFTITATLRAQVAQDARANEPLKQLSLEQLGNVEVTTVSKEPEEVWNTPAAVYVITQDDIRRSGATSIPEALRLAPGLRCSASTAANGP